MKNLMAPILNHAEVLLALSLLAGPALAAPALRSSPSADGPRSTGDWPMVKHDPARSGVTDESLAFPLRLVWTCAASQPPRPAWPEPVKVINRLDFDYAFQPVVAGGIVCFASSADDTVRALDLGTGAEKWHFITGGPIRIAPQIADGKVYAGSDDGFVYCLDAATGKLVWRFRAAPDDDRLIGNERMISRWPIRTGVLVVDGVAYCGAGMWSNDGIYIYALDAATGKVLWCNDTSGIVDGLRTLHMESATDPTGSDFGTFGVCPQGALLATADMLIVPTGKDLPASYDRRTGRLNYYNSNPVVNQSGGSWVTLDGGKFYTISASIVSVPGFDLATGQRDFKAGYSAPRSLKLPVNPYSRRRAVALVHNGKAHFRFARELALAGDMLVVGEDDAVSAQEPALGGKELWRAPVNGQARGLAVADGRLIVSTDKGEISCFAPATGDSKLIPTLRRSGQDSEAGTANSNQSKIQNQKSKIAGLLQEAGVDRGYALVLGDADGAVSVGLATHTRLHVVAVLTDETAAAALRERLLSATDLYGSRVNVQTVERLDRLPFAQNFANAVIVVTPVKGLSGKELYRILRPCGGTLLFPGLTIADTMKLIEQTDASESEIHTTPNTEHLSSASRDRTLNTEPTIVRGRLPGARDWDVGSDDALVKWPLRLLWFGGPGPALVLDRKQGNAIGPVANGRYFVIGNTQLSAVDAYNGCILWTRPIPELFLGLGFTDDDDHLPIAGAGTIHRKGFVRNLAADAKTVQLTLGLYSQGDETQKTVIVLDAHTGEQRAIYGPTASPPAVSLQTPRTWPLEVDVRHSGSVTLQADANGIVLQLTTKDPVVTPHDGWDLFFDFRPPESRYGLYERGAFQAKVFPARDKGTAAAWKIGAWPDHVGTSAEGPQLEVTGAREADGTRTTVVVPWKELERWLGSPARSAIRPRRIAGGRPASFGFAATLNSHDGGEKEPVAQCHLFGDLFAPGWNNGWANVAVKEADPASVPAIIAGAFAAAPKIPVPPVPKAAGESPLLAPRRHVFTGEPEAKIYQSGGICGATVYSADCLIARSTALAIYDFADDSGMRHFDGTKPSCGASQVAANGLLLSSEGRGGCECTTSFQTSLALAPTDRRSQEDWALYYDLDPDARVRQAAFNLGAPGDRRSAAGTLWLAAPRPAGKTLGIPLVPAGASSLGLFRERLPGLRLPVAVELADGGGSYRVNADRTPITGTAEPWIYASGLKGIRKATVRLAFGTSLISQVAAIPPGVDGALADPAWSGTTLRSGPDCEESGLRSTGAPSAVLPRTRTALFVRHDAERLYVAARLPAMTDAKGNTHPWATNTAPETDAFFRGDSFELFLGDATAGRVVHLAVNSAGSRYDALASTGREDRAWTAEWASAVVADPAPGGTGTNGFTVELAIPWKTLAAAGVSRERLALNAMINTYGPSGMGQRGEALRYLGPRGRDYVEHFVPLGLGASPPEPGPHSYTVRLHFAELDDVKPGQRVFDVKLQGRTVLKAFDVVKEAGGARKALVKEFKGVKAADALTLEFAAVTPESAPILSGLELIEEGFLAPKASAEK